MVFPSPPSAGFLCHGLISCIWNLARFASGLLSQLFRQLCLQISKKNFSQRESLLTAQRSFVKCQAVCFWTLNFSARTKTMWHRKDLSVLHQVELLHFAVNFIPAASLTAKLFYGVDFCPNPLKMVTLLWQTRDFRYKTSCPLVWIWISLFRQWCSNVCRRCC